MRCTYKTFFRINPTKNHTTCVRVTLKGICALLKHSEATGLLINADPPSSTYPFFFMLSSHPFSYQNEVDSCVNSAVPQLQLIQYMAMGTQCCSANWLNAITWSESKAAPYPGVSSTTGQSSSKVTER